MDQGALKDMKRLDSTVAQRVVRAVDRLAKEGHGDVKKLKGSDDLLRLRVADWRVLFRLEVELERLVVLEVVHRGDAYG